MRTRLLFPLMLAVSLIACEETPSGPSRASQPIMPLAVGNVWIGRSYALDSLNRPTDIRYDTVSITATETVGGETWYRTSTGALAINRADGLWARVPGAGRALQIAKHPTEVGEIFGADTMAVTVSDPFNELPDSIVVSQIVIGVGRMLGVTAGQFSVTGYRSRTTDLGGNELGEGHPLWSGHEAYFAPGTGPVQRIEYRMTPTGRETVRVWELVEARLK